MQCKPSASYFKDAQANQASYPRSLPDISSDDLSSSIQYQKFVDNETLCIRGLSKYLKAQFVVGMD
jgi:hypothetical protein